MTLIVHLLGSAEISCDDQPIKIRGYKPLALLTYLLITEKTHSRQHLIDLLFDGPSDPKANLRWTLCELQRAIGSGYILANRREITFNFDSAYWLDVAAFEAGEIDLYRGDFLEGLSVRNAFGFEDWAFFERERLRDRYQAGLVERLVADEAQGDDDAVIEIAHQLLRLDNLREDWHQTLIKAYARQGKREAALTQYEMYFQILKTELGIEPVTETFSLVEMIKQG